MIEQLLEAKIIEAVRALNLSGLHVTGFWQAVPDGDVKGREGSDFKAALSVIVATRSYETFTTPKALFNVAATIAVRRDECPTGAGLAQYVSPLVDLVDSWQRDIVAVREALTLTVDSSPVFVPHGFRLDGGPPTTNAAAGAWTVDLSFAVRGIINQPSTGE